MKKLFFFTLFIGMFSSVVSASALDLIDIDEWGYQDVKHSHYSEVDCMSGFKPINKSYRTLKSIEHSSELSDTFYRFTLIQEVYESPEKAQKRMYDLKHPSFPNSKASKMCAIRGGFILGDTVYQIHTDVGAFHKQLQMLTVKLQEQVSRLHIAADSD